MYHSMTGGGDATNAGLPEPARIQMNKVIGSPQV